MKRLLLVVAIAGCGTVDNTPISDGSVPDLGPVADLYFNPYSDLAGHDLTVALPDFSGTTVDLAMMAQPDLAAGGLMPVTIGPINLAAGEEHTICRTMLLPNDAPIDLIELNSTLAPGSHHLILYRSNANAENPQYDCMPLDLSGGDVPIYIAETEKNNDLPLPASVAYHFAAHQMVRLEAHYLNASNQAIVGQGTIDLTVGPAGVYQAADIMFCGSVTPLVNPGVPPGDTTLPAGYYKPPMGVKVFGLTTHEHKRGTLMTVDKSTSTAAGTNLIMGQPYDNPPFNIYTDQNLLTFSGNEGFRWDCSYHNASQMTYHFGQSAESDEMCFFWAYYFPSAGHFISSECWK